MNTLKEEKLAKIMSLVEEYGYFKSELDYATNAEEKALVLEKLHDKYNKIQGQVIRLLLNNEDDFDADSPVDKP